MRSCLSSSIVIGDVGVVVAGRDGAVRSADARARQLLGVGSAGTVEERLREIWHEIEPALVESAPVELSIALAPAQTIRVRVCPLEHAEGSVVLLEDACVPGRLEQVLGQALRYRAFGTLRRDWAHEWKGILNVIQVNHALLARAVRSDDPDAGLVERCLGAIPREIARLDRSIDLVLRAEDDDRQSTFDAGEMTERLMQFIDVRARRQHVTTSFDTGGGSRRVTGFEDRLSGGVLCLLVNALDAMPDRGRLEVSVQGGASVRVRVCDSGPGLAPGTSATVGPAGSVHAQDERGMGLLVVRAVVEAHRGRLSWWPGASRGTCVECDLPAAGCEREG